MKTTVRVRAGDGLLIPLPSDLAIDTTLTVLTPENAVEVLYNRFTRRRLACGDFVEVMPSSSGSADVLASVVADPPEED